MDEEEKLKKGDFYTMENIILNNKLKCPVVGIGTFMLSPADAENSVREALKMGYRLVDTANAYVNERAVGRGIKESGVDRKDVFLSTKLWPSEYENENAADETLERLGVDYVDLLYIHQPAGNWLAGYRQLENKNERYYHRTDEQLIQFAGWKPDFEK